MQSAPLHCDDGDGTVVRRFRNKHGVTQRQNPFVIGALRCGAESEGGWALAAQSKGISGWLRTCSPEKASKMPLSTTKKNRDHVLKSPAVCIFMCLRRSVSIRQQQLRAASAHPRRDGMRGGGMGGGGEGRVGGVAEKRSTLKRLTSPTATGVPSSIALRTTGDTVIPWSFSISST